MRLKTKGGATKSGAHRTDRQTDGRTDERLQGAMSSPIKRFPGDGERRRQWRQREFKVGGTSLVSRLSAFLTEANWWRLIAE